MFKTYYFVIYCMCGGELKRQRRKINSVTLVYMYGTYIECAVFSKILELYKNDEKTS